MATDVVYVDALPYFDQGYDEPGVREAVHLPAVNFMNCLLVGSPWFLHHIA